MSRPPLTFTHLVELLDEHLGIINQAAHSPSKEAIDEVIRAVGPHGATLVELWRRLWPAIAGDESRRQIVMDRISRREPWSAEQFPKLIGDVLLADISASAFARQELLLPPDDRTEQEHAGSSAMESPGGVPVPISSSGTQSVKGGAANAIANASDATSVSASSESTTPYSASPDTTGGETGDDVVTNIIRLAAARLLSLLAARYGADEALRQESMTSMDESWLVARAVSEAVRPRLLNPELTAVRDLARTGTSAEHFADLLQSALPRSAALWSELARALKIDAPATWEGTDTESELDSREWHVTTRRTVELIGEVQEALAEISGEQWRLGAADEWRAAHTEESLKRANAAFALRDHLTGDLSDEDRRQFEDFLASPTARTLLRFGSVLNRRMLDDDVFRERTEQILLREGIYRHEYSTFAIGAVIVDPYDSANPYRLPSVRADTAEGDDLLGVDDYAKAFAMLMASAALAPPLAVGVFGEWGSGKTYFMRRVRKHVETVAREARESGRPQHELGVFKNIAQVEFNAWHYRDADLWASLVEHIFSNLALTHTDQPDEKTRLRDALLDMIAGQESAIREIEGRVEVAANEVASKRTAYDDAAADVARRTKELSRWRVSNAAAIIAREVDADEQIRTKTDVLLKEVGVEAAGKTVADLREAITAGDRTVRATWSIFAPVLTAPDRTTRLVLLALALAIPLALGLILTWLLTYTDLRGIAAAVGWLTWVGSLVLTCVAWVRAQLGWVGKWVRRSGTIINELDGKVAERQKALADGQAAAAGDLARAEAERARAEQELAEAERQVALLRAQLAKAEHSLTPAARLGDFLRERTETEDYRKHLGILALVRRDFAKLSALVADANTRLLSTPVIGEEGLQGSPATGASDPPVNRIILYIDDLDRCTEKQVVQVLQAVHLLLAFELFVVVVGVDGRWVRQALTREHPDLLGVGGEGSDAAPATPRDYLEKIFQIPFRMKSIEEQDARSYIEGLLGVAEGASGPGVNGSPSAGGAESPNPEAAAPPSLPAGAPSETRPVERADSAAVPELSGATSSQPDDAASAAAGEPLPVSSVERSTGAFNLTPRALEITRSEVDAMKDLAAIIGRSPRVIKTYANVYQVLKSTVPAVDQPAFTSELWGSGTFRLVLFLLAVMMGRPGVWRTVHDLLMQADPIPTLGDVLASVPQEARAANEIAWRSVDAYLAGPGRELAGLQVSQARPWVARVARFSFGPALD